MVKSRTGLLGELMENGLFECIEALEDAKAIEITEKYGARNYKPLPVNIVHGDGAQVWDGNGREYIDCIGAYSAVAHGHLNEAVVVALRKQLDRLAVTSRAAYTSEVALFMQALAEYAELDMVCPMNTGAEAVETCIKLARKWAYTKKGVAADQAEIITFEGNFHGRTTTIVGFSSEEQYKENFGPFTPGFITIPFDDLAAVEEAINGNTAAILIEPIQAEGGIIIPEDGYLKGLHELCDKHNVLLIFDEVQTGFCRTGFDFAWMYEQAKPDLLAVGKPLGGGILPVSAAIGRREVMEVFLPGDHGSTFGGNPLGAVVALAALLEMEREDYSGRSKANGEYLLKAFQSFDFDFIEDIRGRGLLVGLEVEEGFDTKRLSDELLARGILTKETRNRTFRFSPPIVIERSALDQVVERVESALKAAAG